MCGCGSSQGYMRFWFVFTFVLIALVYVFCCLVMFVFVLKYKIWHLARRTHEQMMLTNVNKLYFTLLYHKISILDKIFMSCHIITILYPFASLALSIISMFVNYLHIVLKTISSDINISKHGLFDKTPCFLWQKTTWHSIKNYVVQGVCLHFLTYCQFL